jgi:hypothetical protein
MPPRYAYWTILIDGQPTAFRARERAELQPTLVQLQRKNTNVTMRWFARGKLWDSREAEQADFQQQRQAAMEPRERRDRPAGAERRGSEWRPGGTHKDPRDRFKKKNRPERAWSEKDPATQRDRDKPGYAAKKPWEGKPGRDQRRPAPSGGPGEKKPWMNKPRGDAKPPWSGPPRDSKPPAHRTPFDGRKRDGGWQNKPPVPNDRPWQTKPTGPRAQRTPWKPEGDSRRTGSFNKPGGPPRGDRPWTKKPEGGWRGKPAGGPPRGDRPADQRGAFDPRKREGGWRDRPHDPNRKPPPERSFNPRTNDDKFNPRAPRTGGRPPRKRNDDPDRE